MITNKKASKPTNQPTNQPTITSILAAIAVSLFCVNAVFALPAGIPDEVQEKADKLRDSRVTKEKLPQMVESSKGQVSSKPVFSTPRGASEFAEYNFGKFFKEAKVKYTIKPNPVKIVKKDKQGNEVEATLYSYTITFPGYLKKKAVYKYLWYFDKRTEAHSYISAPYVSCNFVKKFGNFSKENPENFFVKNIKCLIPVNINDIRGYVFYLTDTNKIFIDLKKTKDDNSTKSIKRDALKNEIEALEDCEKAVILYEEDVALRFLTDISHEKTIYYFTVKN